MTDVKLEEKCTNAHKLIVEVDKSGIQTRVIDDEGNEIPLVSNQAAPFYKDYPWSGITPWTPDMPSYVDQRPGYFDRDEDCWRMPYYSCKKCGQYVSYTKVVVEKAPQV